MKTNYKRIPFDLNKAKFIMNGEMKGRIVTRDGRQARIICFDRKENEDIFDPPKNIVALVTNKDGSEGVFAVRDDGMILLNEESDYDLLIEVPTYNRDYSNFIPQKWQPCLVRESIYDHWKVRVCADNKQQVTFYDSSNCCSGDILWDFKLPLSKITERLIGTTKSYEQLIQEFDGHGQD